VAVRKGNDWVGEVVVLKVTEMVDLMESIRVVRWEPWLES
jgi:hypothetical protein